MGTAAGVTLAPCKLKRESARSANDCGHEHGRGSQSHGADPTDENAANFWRHPQPGRITLATSAGLPFLALAFHVAAGTVGLVAGTVAIAARKGGPWHRRSGQLFVAAMLAMGLSAVGIALFEKKSSVASGAVAAYLVFTGWTTLRPLASMRRVADFALMLLAWLTALGGFAQAFAALGRPGHQIEGVPAGMSFFMSTVILLAAVGDVRLIRAPNLQRSQRIARHLWRMCFGLFIATGSFVAQLVRMTFMPSWTRSIAAILVLAAGPLDVLVYWMWRVRGMCSDELQKALSMT